MFILIVVRVEVPEGVSPREMLRQVVLCPGQAFRWHSREQYLTLLHPPHLCRACPR